MAADVSLTCIKEQNNLDETDQCVRNMESVKMEEEHYKFKTISDT